MTNIQTTPKTKEQIRIEELELELKLLKESKAKKQSPTAKLVTFKNQKGETITGYGELYYCVSKDNKLHWKRDNQCTIIESTKS